MKKKKKKKSRNDVFCRERLLSQVSPGWNERNTKLYVRGNALRINGRLS